MKITLAICTNYTTEQACRAFYTVTFAISGLLQEGVAMGTFLWDGEALY